MQSQSKKLMRSHCREASVIYFEVKIDYILMCMCSWWMAAVKQLCSWMKIFLCILLLVCQFDTAIFWDKIIEDEVMNVFLVLKLTYTPTWDSLIEFNQEKCNLYGLPHLTGMYDQYANTGQWWVDFFSAYV